jgi:hypothetical protein
MDERCNFPHENNRRPGFDVNTRVRMAQPQIGGQIISTVKQDRNGASNQNFRNRRYFSVTQICIEKSNLGLRMIEQREGFANASCWSDDISSRFLNRGCQIKGNEWFVLSDEYSNLMKQVSPFEGVPNRHATQTPWKLPNASAKQRMPAIKPFNA